MINSKIKLFFIFLIGLYPLCCQAYTQEPISPHPLYVGVSGGYGSTTWTGLVPLNVDEDDVQATVLRFSTPIGTSEGGGLWGFFAGYELLPAFALEVSYMHYPNATIFFDEISNFTLEHGGENGLTSFVTKTETISVMGKFMVLIPHTKIRAYSSVGGANLHRQDILNDAWRYTPTFGLGFNRDFGTHLMGEIAANYTAGYGEASFNPTQVYFPFLYAVFARVAYRI